MSSRKSHLVTSKHRHHSSSYRHRLFPWPGTVPLLPLFLAFLLLLLPDHVTFVAGHGCMLIPAQRGATTVSAPFQPFPVPGEERDVYDQKMHFPSGDKNGRGSGHAYQIHRVRWKGWTPYDPFNPSFHLRAGVCGDTLYGPNARDHLKGGKYYNGGRVVKTYNQGGVIDVTLGIVQHHNGYMELYLCDVQHCKHQDISHSCFTDGHCHKLMRAKGDKCETGREWGCAPTDPNYPSRWYVPCKNAGRRMTTKRHGDYVLYGPGTIRYRLPKHVHCEHCVLQWYWTSANNCNPPGVVEFFKGRRAPKQWGNCPGEGGAKGGYTKVQKACGEYNEGEMKVPEEYYQCADIRIRKRYNNVAKPTPTATSTPSPKQARTRWWRQSPTPTSSPTPPKTTMSGYEPFEDGSGAIEDVVVTRNGKRWRSLNREQVVQWEGGRTQWSFEAIVADGVSYVHFVLYVVKGRPVLDAWVSRTPGSGRRMVIPYDLKQWRKVPRNTWLTLMVSGREGGGGRYDTDKMAVYFEDK